MVFGTRQMICKLPRFKLSFPGKELLATYSVKDQGVIFDPTLSFDCHIRVLTTSCISKLAQINRVNHAFNSELLVIIINALVKMTFSEVSRANDDETFLPGFTPK